ncbi:MAG: hypothetical protein IPK17_38785 [Chloroflexi bacterium]|uniref:hypothetical protein n=1 Tax=Candidatus Flexifilum breve TaxID=3140694 RepID=UPI0031354949|nr:hypothetical protein [Chloroflexota bacterium]
MLVVLPFLAGTLQRQFTRWITGNYKLLTRFSGAILVFIAVFGIVTEVLPISSECENDDYRHSTKPSSGM